MVEILGRMRRRSTPPSASGEMFAIPLGKMGRRGSERMPSHIATNSIGSNSIDPTVSGIIESALKAPTTYDNRRYNMPVKSGTEYKYNNKTRRMEKK